MPFPLPILPTAFRLVTEDITRRILYRVYSEKRDPLKASFVRGNRYDCPSTVLPAHQFGILYLGFELETCWMETVVRSNMVRPAGTDILIPKSEMTNRWACSVLAAQPVTLAKFADEPLIDLGDSASNIMGDSYIRTWEWSRLLHAHANPAVDGIYYRSRFKSDQFCVALFERAIISKQLIVLNPRSVDPASSPEIQTIMRRYSIKPS